MSWRNPDARHSKWGFDTYVRAILDALDAVEDITGVDRTHLLAACSGGILASMAAAHLAATRPAGPARRLDLLVTLLDQARAGTTGALVDETDGRRGGRRVPARGLPRRAQTLAEVFAWLRPGDLIWNYWVNNYLQGKQAAGVRHPVLERRHHPDDRRAAPRLRRRRACTTGWPARAASRCSAPRSTSSRSTVDSYVVAGIADHICPWQSCYRSTPAARRRRAGSCSPPTATSPRWSTRRPTPSPATRSPTTTPADPAGVGGGAPRPSKGSWWPDFARWLARSERRERRPPRRSAARRLAARTPRPARYVLDDRDRSDPTPRVTVGGRRLRVAVRPGTDPDRPPLLLCNGIGADLTAFDPFVDALDPAIEVVRFDRRASGGSPVAAAALPVPAAGPAGRSDARRAGVRAVRRAGRLLGRRASPNSSRCRTRAAAVGWCWWPRRWAGPWCLPARGCSCGWRRHGGTGTSATPARSRARSTAGGCARTPSWCGTARPPASSGRGYAYQLAAGLGWTSLPFLPLLRQPTLMMAGADDPIIPLVNARADGPTHARRPPARLPRRPPRPAHHDRRAGRRRRRVSNLSQQRREPGGVLAQQRDQLRVRLGDAGRGPGQRETRDQPPVARAADGTARQPRSARNSPHWRARPSRRRPRSSACVELGRRGDGVLGERAQLADQRPPVRLVGQQQPAQRGRLRVPREHAGVLGGWSGSGSTSATCPPSNEARCTPQRTIPRRCSTTGRAAVGSVVTAGSASRAARRPRANPRRSGSRTRYSSATSRFSSR